MDIKAPYPPLGSLWIIKGIGWVWVRLPRDAVELLESVVHIWDLGCCYGGIRNKDAPRGPRKWQGRDAACTHVGTAELCSCSAKFQTYDKGVKQWRGWLNVMNGFLGHFVLGTWGTYTADAHYLVASLWYRVLVPYSCTTLNPKPYSLNPKPYSCSTLLKRLLLAAREL